MSEGREFQVVADATEEARRARSPVFLVESSAGHGTVSLQRRESYTLIYQLQETFY